MKILMWIKSKLDSFTSFILRKKVQTHNYYYPVALLGSILAAVFYPTSEYAHAVDYLPSLFVGFVVGLVLGKMIEIK